MPHTTQTPETACQPDESLRSCKETTEALIIAFVLAYVFRAFAVEAFVIPTGSMADTLRGAHFRITCPTCGYQFNYGFAAGQFGYRQGVIPPERVTIPSGGLDQSGIPLCPMCGRQIDRNVPRRVSNGDRILVLKYPYYFASPQRWDVIVFKNPENTHENFIKRLIGLPGETLEIIDGDVYIDGHIQQKPPAVQDKLWIPIYHSDFQVPDHTTDTLDTDIWTQPWRPRRPRSAWSSDDQSHRLRFSGAGQEHALRFDTARLRKLAPSFLAYDGNTRDDQAIASDLKLSCLLEKPKDTQGRLSLRLGKYDRLYQADINFNGRCQLCLIMPDGSREILCHQQLPPLRAGTTPITFSNLDHRLTLQLAEHTLAWQGPDDPALWGYDPQAPFLLPDVQILAHAGPFALDRLALHRDTHYTNSLGNGPGRGTQGQPFTLHPDEFFVLGDNSTASHDSRFWRQPQPHNGQPPYRAGIVPRQYLVGRAWCVYWPAGYHVHPKIRYAWIPNFGQMRFIR